MIPTIDIHMDPLQFTFSTARSQPVLLATKVFISSAKGRWEIVAIGENQSVISPDVLCIPLFEGNPAPPASMGKVELLQWFFYFGIGKSMTGYSFISYLFRPKVVLHGSDKFTDLLKGYQGDIFTTAVMGAGIKSVQFK